MKIETLIDSIIKVCNEELTGVILTGSCVKGRYINNWSDIDLFVIQDVLNVPNMLPIIDVCRKFGVKKNLHVGLSFLTTDEYNSKDIYATYFKALLMKYHFSTGKTKIVYGSLKPQDIDWRRYRDFLLRELNFFKAYYRNGLRDLNNKDLLVRCIKCATYISTISILITSPNIKDCWPTAKKLRNIFKTYPGDFILIDEIEEWKENISEINDYEERSYQLTNYIEEFLQYFFKVYRDV